MPLWPTTDHALIAQLGDPNNERSWHDFDALYRRVIYRFACRSGADHHTSEEVAADVLRRVSRASLRWGKERPPEHFAAWLRRVAKNSLLNHVCRELNRRGTGGTTHQLELSQRAAPTDLASSRWEEDRQREILILASRRIEGDFDPASWQAFWETHIEGESIASVSQKLGKSSGAIYAIRSRVIRRLRNEVNAIVNDLSQIEESS